MCIPLRSLSRMGDELSTAAIGPEFTGRAVNIPRRFTVSVYCEKFSAVFTHEIVDTLVNQIVFNC